MARLPSRRWTAGCLILEDQPIKKRTLAIGLATPLLLAALHAVAPADTASAAAAVAATAVKATPSAGASATKPAPVADPLVLKAARRLFAAGLAATSRGESILTDLRSTRDPALLPLFAQVQKSSSPALQLLGMVYANYVTRDPKTINIPNLLGNADPSLITPTIAELIETGTLSSRQLAAIADSAVQPAQRLMAASVLVDQHNKIGQKVATELLAADQPAVRYYAAMTLLRTADAALHKRGLAVLAKLVTDDSPRLVNSKLLLLARVRAQKITTALPWVAQMAQSRASDARIQRAAITTLLALKDKQGAGDLVAAIAHASGVINRIELAFLAIEFGKYLTAADVKPLAITSSPLLADLAKAVQEAAGGGDPHTALVALVEQGQPIFLNWLLEYAKEPGTPHRLEYLKRIIKLGIVADNQRDLDYARAVLAAEYLAKSKEPAARKLLAELLQMPRGSAVEAVLAGMVRSNERNFSPLLLPLWHGLKHRRHRVSDYAALLLAREGHARVLPQLAHAVMFELTRSRGFRAVAGWYYAKLTNSTNELLKNLQAPKTAAASGD